MDDGGAEGGGGAFNGDRVGTVGLVDEEEELEGC